MKNLKKIMINENATIKQALNTISKGAIKIVFAIDNKGKLIGTLSDGDIRRGLLKGLSTSNSVNSLINKKPLIGKKNENRKNLLNKAISKNIQQIPIIDNRGKVIEIFLTDDFRKDKIKSNKVVIMAGGKGMRLRPLTRHIPKPMLKVGNKPILETIIERFNECGFGDFIICVNYKSKMIKNYFGNGEKFGVNIKYVNEKIKMGTAGALSLIKQKLKEPFFVINGDLLTNLNYQKMLDFHIKNKAIATMGVKEHRISSQYGEVNLFNENIISINEKPVHKFFANAGIYILDPKCINLIPRKFFDMTTLFKKIILKKNKTISFPLDEYWKDIVMLIDYQKANEDFLKNLNN